MKVLTYPNPILRRKSEPVSNVGVELKALALRMLQVMDAHNGYGLSAPQIGQSIRLFVMQPNLIFFNPEIVQREGHQYQQEGCLSFPNKFKKHKRPRSIRIKYVDEYNVSQERVFQGMDAICVEHEIEHLDGVLLLDPH